MSGDLALLRSLEKLLHTERHAALGTLSRQGWPAVSMVPYAVDRASAGLIIHISELAAHTRALQRDPRSSLMICQSPEATQAVHDLPRVTLQTQAHQLERDSTPWLTARDSYLARFPEAAFMTEFTDFHFVLLEPIRVRQIAGFGAARTLTLEQALATLRQISH